MTDVPPWGDAKPLPGCQVMQSDEVPQPAPGTPSPRRKNAVVRKIALMNRFYDRLTKYHPRLPALAVAIWGWLWRCERNGRARTSVARLSERFGVSERTVRRALEYLRKQGLLVVVRRGRPGQPTIFRVSATPRKGAS